jgi:hypothetical protein
MENRILISFAGDAHLYVDMQYAWVQQHADAAEMMSTCKCKTGTCGDICLGLYQPDNHGSQAQEKGW